MREVELKAVVTDLESKAGLIHGAGATLIFQGSLRDRRYDTAEGELNAKDEVVRVRTYQSSASKRVLLDWKGAVDTTTGYKVRDELSTEISDAHQLEAMLEKLGYIIVKEIDRRIIQYELGRATIRFEEYPRMDRLVEVEGVPEAIEEAIAVLRMSRGEFTSESLGAFVTRFEQRTGVKAATSESELAGIQAISCPAGLSR